MNIYISVTSIFQRQNVLVNFLKTVLNLSLKPTKCFIFLSENPYLLDKGFKNKTITNQELKNIIETNNILELRWVKNIGPYRKLIPILKEKWNENCLIFTFDDDIILDSYILSSYINDFNKYKCCISYRGFDVTIDNIDEFKYSHKRNKQTRNKYNFANSGVGMITHPSFFHGTNNLILDETIFLEVCPTADDLWYYVWRIFSNIKTIIIQNENKLFYLENFDYKTALFHNYNKNKNSLILKNICKYLKEKKNIIIR